MPSPDHRAECSGRSGSVPGAAGPYTGNGQRGRLDVTCEMSHVSPNSRAIRHLLSMFMVSLILALGVSAPALAAPGSIQTPGRSTAIEPPEVTAQGIFSFDIASGITLYEKNPDERLQIGSTVKVATALVVLKHGDPADEVLIEESDTVDITVYSNMQLQAGDTLTVGTLLYGLLIPSGNDGANALARHVGLGLCGCDDATDASEAFIQAMNDYAAELGLENTRFANPSGIDAEGTYSSARDIATLFGELMKNERLANIVAESAYQFLSVGPNPRTYSEDTTNDLLGQLGVIGGKTGSTEDAGGCVVLARQVNGDANTVITAVLGADLEYQDSVIVDGSDQRWDDARDIFGAMDEQFSWVTPGADNTFPGLTEEMAVWQVQFNDPPTVPYPSSGVTAAYQLVLGEPVDADAEGGAVRLYYDQVQVGNIPVYAATAQSATDAGESGQ